jgi:hypothetical protein
LDSRKPTAPAHVARPHGSNGCGGAFFGSGARATLALPVQEHLQAARGASFEAEAAAFQAELRGLPPFDTHLQLALRQQERGSWRCVQERSVDAFEERRRARGVFQEHAGASASVLWRLPGNRATEPGQDGRRGTPELDGSMRRQQRTRGALAASTYGRLLRPKVRGPLECDLTSMRLRERLDGLGGHGEVTSVGGLEGE